MHGRDAVLGIAVVAALGGAAWWLLGRGTGTTSPSSDRDRDAVPIDRPTSATTPTLDARGRPTAVEPPVASTTSGEGAEPPRGTLSIRGRVLAADGTPVEGATVEARTSPPSETKAIAATTTSDGAFVLDRLAAGMWAVRADADGHANAAARIAEAGASGIDLTLGALGWVEGTVLDAEGMPFSGLLAFERGTGRGSEWQFAEVRSGGRFRSPPLAAGAWKVDVATPGFVAQRATHAVVADGRALPVDVVAARAPRLAVIARDEDGGPVEVGVAAHLESAPSSGGSTVASREWDAVSRGVASAELEPLEIGGLAAGTWRVTVRARGYLLSSATVFLRPAETTTHEARLARPVWVDLRVVDENGNPVTGAVVRATRDGGELPAFDDGNRTGPGGRLRAGVAPGFVRFEARTRTTVSELVDHEARRGEEREVTLVLKPRPGR